MRRALACWPGLSALGCCQSLCLVLCLALAAAGCAPAPRPQAPPPQPAAAPAPADAELQDIRDIPQNLTAFLAQSTAIPGNGDGLDAPFLSPQAQAAFLARFRAAHFGPWDQANASYGVASAMWGLGKLGANRHYGENLRLLGPGFMAEMEALCQPWSYPSLARPAIATVSTALRVLPTNRPGFLKPTRPGEGYPFDYWQNSGVWAGTPLLVTHLSADGAWALVEARNAGGWVHVADIAFVDETFMALWRALPLLAVTHEHTPVREPQDAGGLNLFDGRIGMVLPLLAEDETGFTALAPARGADGRAKAVSVRLARSDAAAMPLAATPRNLARLGDQMLGQPYGWGGYLDNRDCSALMLDLLAPFGVFLPRNSSQQAKSGQFITFEGLDDAGRESLVLLRGVPLLTLLYKPGHIMLYLGRVGSGPLLGHAAMLHAVWGLKTLDQDGVEGRKVIGRTVITTLAPGGELPDVARSGTLLGHLSGMTLLAPGGEPPTTPDRTR